MCKRADGSRWWLVALLMTARAQAQVEVTVTDGGGWSPALVLMVAIAAFGAGVLVGQALRSSPRPETRRRSAPQVYGRLEAVSGPHAGEVFLLGPNTAIGRRQGEVRLVHDPTVSSLHARIQCRPDGKVLYTDDSSNGSRVDGSDVLKSSVAIGPNSRIELGLTTLVYRSPRGTQFRED